MLIKCRCLHKIKPNQPPSFVNLLARDDSQGDMPSSSNIPLNPPNWQYYLQYPFQQPYHHHKTPHNTHDPKTSHNTHHPKTQVICMGQYLSYITHHNLPLPPHQILLPKVKKRRQWMRWCLRGKVDSKGGPSLGWVMD